MAILNIILQFRVKATTGMICTLETGNSGSIILHTTSSYGNEIRGITTWRISQTNYLAGVAEYREGSLWLDQVSSGGWNMDERQRWPKDESSIIPDH